MTWTSKPMGSLVAVGLILGVAACGEEDRPPPAPQVTSVASDDFDPVRLNFVRDISNNGSEWSVPVDTAGRLGLQSNHDAGPVLRRLLRERRPRLAAKIDMEDDSDASWATASSRKPLDELVSFVKTLKRRDGR